MERSLISLRGTAAGAGDLAGRLVFVLGILASVVLSAVSGGVALAFSAFILPALHAMPDPEAVEANLRRQLLRFHGHDLPAGDAGLDRWVWLHRTTVESTGDAARAASSGPASRSSRSPRSSPRRTASASPCAACARASSPSARSSSSSSASAEESAIFKSFPSAGTRRGARASNA